MGYDSLSIQRWKNACVARVNLHAGLVRAMKRNNQCLQNMATVTVYFQKRLQLSSQPVEKCLRAVLGLVRWYQDSHVLKAHIFTAMLIPNMPQFLRYWLKQINRGNRKRKGKVCLSFVLYFWLGQFLKCFYQGLEGYFRDPGIDCFQGSGIEQNLGMGRTFTV